ncbi:hypothetical protein BH23ACT5_BH23ACT5_13830 [soil metagenome]
MSVSAKPGGSFDLPGKEVELTELRDRASSPELWDDANEARRVTQTLSRYEELFALVASLEQQVEDAELLWEMAAEAGDEVNRSEADAELAVVSKELDRLELESLFFEEYDHHDAIFSVHAGAGGVDAQD